MLFTPVKDDAHQMADKQWRCGCLIPGKLSEIQTLRNRQP
jgi:hypothetical protein